MTVALMAAGAVMAALGTRAAAVAFAAAAAVSAATGQGVLVLAGTWTAAMAAGLVAFGGPPRRVALPAAGAAAVLVSGSATNAAVVLGAWILGTLAAVLARGGGAAGRRFAFALLSADLLVAIAVGYAALVTGFVSWPGGLDETARVVLLLAVLVRVPLVAGPAEDRPESGLLVVRAQVLVGASVALGGATSTVAEVGLLAGAGLFAAAGTLRRPTRSDATLEAGLITSTLGASTLGWVPAGWTWGAAAAGTLMHNLRLRVGDGRTGTAALPKALVTGGGIGAPVLPVVAAMVAAAISRRGWEAALVVAGLGAGLAGRAWFGSREVRSRAAPDAWAGARTLAAVALAASAALWAPLLTLPRGVGGDPVPWPPAWAGVVVVLAALAGLRWPGLAPARERRRPAFGAWERLARPIVGPVDLSGARGALVGPIVALAALAGALFVTGLLRGFL